MKNVVPDCTIWQTLDHAGVWATFAYPCLAFVFGNPHPFKLVQTRWDNMQVDYYKPVPKTPPTETIVQEYLDAWKSEPIGAWLPKTIDEPLVLDLSEGINKATIRLMIYRWITESYYKLPLFNDLLSAGVPTGKAWVLASVLKFPLIEAENADHSDPYKGHVLFNVACITRSLLDNWQQVVMDEKLFPHHGCFGHPSIIPSLDRHFTPSSGALLKPQSSSITWMYVPTIPLTIPSLKEFACHTITT